MMQEVEIVNLQLDTENYRLGPQPDQPQTIKAMIEEQGDKLVELAKDIVEHGLSPIELIAVCPIDGKFRVLEGNRRITALKLLNEPGLASGAKISKPIHALAAASAGKLNKKCWCIVVPSKQEAFKWIQRKHDTGLGGAATITWNAMAIRRAKEALGNRLTSLEVVDLVHQHGNLSEGVKNKLKKFPITNLERILEDPAALTLLNVEIKNNELVCGNNQEWTINAFTKIVTDIADKKIKVGDIEDKKLREGYVKQVASGLGKPTKVDPWAVSQGGNISKPIGGGIGGRKKTPVTDRKYLIPTTCKSHITHPRIQEIFFELQKRLKLDEVPNSISVMFRVLVEFSADHFIKKKSIAPKNDKLITKLNAIESFMRTNNIMTDKELKPIRLALGNPNDLLSTETLNAYVHNMQVMPKANDLRRAWDSLEPFFINLWK